MHLLLLHFPSLREFWCRKFMWNPSPALAVKQPGKCVDDNIVWSPTGRWSPSPASSPSVCKMVAVLSRHNLFRVPDEASKSIPTLLNLPHQTHDDECHYWPGAGRQSTLPWYPLPLLLKCYPPSRSMSSELYTHRRKSYILAGITHAHGQLTKSSDHRAIFVLGSLVPRWSGCLLGSRDHPSGSKTID